MFRAPQDENRRSLRAEVRPTERASAFAKDLRAEMSPPERLLWSKLRGGQLKGLKFRKQHPIGPWIADFYCHAAVLVVEIDGPTHRRERKRLDEARDRWMVERNVGVLRVTGRDVFENLSGVLSTILRRCEERAAKLQTPPPALPGEVAERSKAGGGADAREGVGRKTNPLRLEDSAPPPPGAGEAG